MVHFALDDDIDDETDDDDFEDDTDESDSDEDDDEDDSDVETWQVYARIPKPSIPLKDSLGLTSGPDLSRLAPIFRLSYGPDTTQLAPAPDGSTLLRRRP